MAIGESLLGRSARTVSVVVLLAAALISVNVLAAMFSFRLDITEEGLYTLSEGSERILAGFEEPVTVKFFYSESLADLPVNVKTYATKVSELLAEYEAKSGGKLTLEQVDPEPDTEDEEWATRYGLSGVQLPDGNRLFLGMVVLSAGRESVVPFFDFRREKFLEYDISEALARIQQSKQIKVGLISYLPVGGYFDPRTGQQQGEWAFVTELRKAFEVETLQEKGLVEIPEDIKLILLIHPKQISDTVSYAVDQFLLRGGRLIAFMDPFSRHDTTAGQRMDANFSSELEKLFGAWKITYDHTKVLADLAQATRVNTPAHGVVEFPVWVTIRNQYFNRESVITSQLDQLTLPDPGAFAAGEGFAHTFTPLLTSSNQSGWVDRVAVRMASPLELGRDLKTDGETRVIAALVTGTFDSAFPGGPPPPPVKEVKEGEEPEPPPAYKLPHLAKGGAETSVLLMGDSDFLADQFAVRHLNFFGQQVVQPINDNLNFVLNAVEFLVGDQNLIHVRSRGQINRPFTKVAELQVAAQREYQTEEKMLSDALEKVRARLRELESAKGKSEEVILSPAQIEEIKNFRLEEQRTRRALREVRKVLRQDIEWLGNTLLILNLLAVPLLVALFGFVTIMRRSKRSGGRT